MYTTHYRIEPDYELRLILQAATHGRGSMHGSCSFKFSKSFSTLAPLYKINSKLITGEESGKGYVVSEDVYDNNHFGAFRKELWRLWVEGRYVYDVMFCRMLNPICSAEMTQSFVLAQCQMLGARVQSIATFSPQFYSSYLLALCHVTQGQHALADKELSNAEEACLDEPQTDLNDKRIAMYLNIMARCYIRMGNLGRARYVIHSSLRVFPSPRNPARYLRYQLDYGDSWNYVKQGFKLVVLSVFSYAIVQYMRGHFRNNHN